MTTTLEAPSLSSTTLVQGSNGTAGPTRWRPTKHLTEPPVAPPLDHRIQEEANATAAAQAAGFEGRRVRRFLQRRTVDYHSSMLRWSLRRGTASCVRDDKFLYPSAHQIVNLLPAAAYAESAQAVTTNLVHTSTNKIRCPVNVVRWTPEGRRLLTGSQSGEFTLWNGLTFNFETILQAHDHPIRALLYSKSGAWILSSDQGGVIKYFQANMNNLQVLTAHREAIRGLSFSPDDSRFVSASDDSTLKIWAFDEAREEKTLKGHNWDAKCVEWHPWKGLIVSGSKDNLVKFWDPRSGGNLATFLGHKNTVQAVKWSLDGNLVASASTDQVIKLYDIRSMRELYTLKGHGKEACSLDWHPTHPDLLVSGGGEGAMHYWSLRASDPTTPIHSVETAHDSNVWALSWHPLGHVLASGSNDHTTRFWERARPEDGRREDGAADAELKAARRRNAAKGGEEWDDDFIPGLTSRRPPPPSRPDPPARPPMQGGPGAYGSAPQPLGMTSYGGAGGAAGAPSYGRPPSGQFGGAQQQQQVGHGANALPVQGQQQRWGAPQPQQQQQQQQPQQGAAPAQQAWGQQQQAPSYGAQYGAPSQAAQQPGFNGTPGGYGAQQGGFTQQQQQQGPPPPGGRIPPQAQGGGPMRKWGAS